MWVALPAANVAWIRKAHTRRIAIHMSRGFDDKERDAPLRAPGSTVKIGSIQFRLGQ